MKTLKQIMTEQGRTWLWLRDSLGCSDQTIRNWRKKDNMPKIYKEKCIQILGEDFNTKD